jgi:hypothetical protein
VCKSEHCPELSPCQNVLMNNASKVVVLTARCNICGGPKEQCEFDRVQLRGTPDTDRQPVAESASAPARRMAMSSLALGSPATTSLRMVLFDSDNAL